MVYQREVRVGLEYDEKNIRKVLKGFGHVEKMGEDRMIKRQFRACVEYNRRR